MKALEQTVTPSLPRPWSVHAERLLTGFTTGKMGSTTTILKPVIKQSFVLCISIFIITPTVKM